MTEFYSGDDLSSLPLTKEELALVEIVRDDDERDWNRIVRERKSAFLAAELFSERRNAVSWFELGRDCRVLEIGSGYGALTGALADRAGTVVSFEDSEIRGAINRFRQRRHKNVAVYSDDFKDIIELADVRKFDVITLMGEGADVSRLAEYAKAEVPPALAAIAFVCRPPLESPTGRFLGMVHFQWALRERPQRLLGSVLDKGLDGARASP